MEGDQSRSDRLLIEFIIQAFGIVVEQGVRVFYLIVDLAFLHQVFIKRIEEVKVVVLAEIEPRKIARQKTNILQLKNAFGGVGVTNEVGTLFNAIKEGLGCIVCAGEAELTHATANIQYFNAVSRRQEMGSVL